MMKVLTLNENTKSSREQIVLSIDGAEHLSNIHRGTLTRELQSQNGNQDRRIKRPGEPGLMNLTTTPLFSMK
jgi:hypothetical protein